MFLDSKIDQDDGKWNWIVQDQNGTLCHVHLDRNDLGGIFLGADFVPKGFSAPKVFSPLCVLCFVMLLAMLYYVVACMSVAQRAH